MLSFVLRSLENMACPDIVTFYLFLFYFTISSSSIDLDSKERES
jgi:hypothetical protein